MNLNKLSSKDKSRISLLALSCITLMGFLLRVSFIARTDLWADEAFTGLTVRQDWGGMFATIVADAAHPPLYYILLKFWTLFAGTSPIGLRSFSLVLGTLLIPLGFYFFKRINGNLKAGLVSAFILALSPFFVNYSVEARSYSLLAVLGVLAMLSFYLALTSPRRTGVIFKNKWGQVWVLTSVLLMLTHYLAILLVGTFLLIALYFWFVRAYPKAHSFLIAHKFQILLAVGFLVMALVNILDITSFRLVGRGTFTNTWLAAPDLNLALRFIFAFLFGVDRQALGYPPLNDISLPITSSNLSLILLLLIVVLAMWHLRLKQNLHKFLLAVLSLQLIMAFGGGYLGVNFLLERYLILSGVALVLLVGYYLGSLDLVNLSLGIGIYLLLLLRVEQKFSFIPYSEVSEFLKTQQASDVIVVSPFDYLVLQYYMDGKTDNIYVLQRDRLDLKQWGHVRADKVITNLEAIGRLPEVDFLISNESNLPARYDWQLVDKVSEDISIYRL